MEDAHGAATQLGLDTRKRRGRRLTDLARMAGCVLHLSCSKIISEKELGALFQRKLAQWFMNLCTGNDDVREGAIGAQVVR